MRKVFFDTLKNIIPREKNIFFLTGDLGVKFFYDLKSIDPKRFINVGVAEANMVGLASGLALSGKNVYCYSIVPFLTMKAFEQIRVDICYNNLNVKLLGSGGGLVYGIEGITHHAIEDIAIMRSLPNMTVVAPGDAKESQALAEESIHYPGPIYIRFGRDSDPVVHGDNFEFKIGKGIIVKEGKDICLITTSTMLYAGKVVSEILEKQDLKPSLISMHTIKPLDLELIQECAKNHQAIFTLEEHSIIGGLGGAVAEALAELKYGKLFKRIGIPDRYAFPVIGGPDYLREKLGLTPELISKTLLEEYKKI